MPKTSLGRKLGGRFVQWSKSGQINGLKWLPVADSGAMSGLRVPGSVESGTVPFGLIFQKEWCLNTSKECK